MPPKHPPLPVEDVRDLLGITRALWRACFAGDASAEQLGELEEIGRLYRLALELAKAGPDTLGGKASWKWAEQATEKLGQIVAEDPALVPLVDAVAARLRRNYSR